MKRAWRIAWKIAAVVAALAVVLAITLLIAVRSAWFANKVHAGMVDAVEKATGGRMEMGAWSFDWRRLRVEVDNLTLHGTEPAGKPPLLHAEKIVVGLKIVSLWTRDVDLESAEVTSPAVYVIVAPDGSTNMPKPKTPGKGNTMETVLKAAVGHFDLRKGVFEVESRGKTPFELSGRNLSTRLAYEAAGPRYRGEISVNPLDARFGAFERAPWAVSAVVSAERDRIVVESAKVATDGVDLQFTGEVRNLADPRATAKYTLRANAAAAKRLLRVKHLERGSMEVSGTGEWNGGASYSARGDLHVYGFDYRDGGTRITDARVDGALEVSAKQAEIHGLRFSGSVNGIAGQGNAALAALRGDELTLGRITAAALGGEFHGDAQLQRFDEFHLSGSVGGVDIRRVVAVYGAGPVPWDGQVSGDVKLAGSLQQSGNLEGSAELKISPAGSGPPVHGMVTAAYNQRAGILDLGHSTISLPHTKVDFSGALGKQLRVLLETGDLNDFLPLLGDKAGAIPVKLVNGGRAVFDGTATGTLDTLQAVGKLTASHAQYNDEALDSLTANVTASASGIQLGNATAMRGPLHAQLSGGVALQNWAIDPSCPIAGTVDLRNASVTDLAAALKLDVPAKGAVDLTARVSGTWGAPQAIADMKAANGSIEDEPYSRFAAHLVYGGNKLELSGGQLEGPGKQITLAASYEHQPNRFDTGRLRFQISSNATPLAEVRFVQRDRPGAQGTIQITANGAVDIAPPAGGQLGYRIEDLHANISALGLKLGPQPFGDVRLTANSESGALHAHLDSNFANSSIQGDGEWQLRGDYPGGATIRFSKLDFGQLNAWLSPGSGSPDYVGAAEGSLRIDGSALKPAAMTAELNIPTFRVAPAGRPSPGALAFALTNSGPIVARLANSTVTVESARFTGPSTDVSLTGKAALEPKVALDLRAAGRIELGLLHDFNRDILASGAILLDGTIRGSLSEPLVSGRLQFQNASFNLASFPNGISQASGAIAFSGNRATIQNFTGETGGGKIQLTGFATYANGDAVFRVHARAQQVRIRKPEGVSTVADADLNLSGTTARSLLAGTLTIDRVAFNPESDLSSIFASSAQPVATPAAQTGFLSDLGLDVQISTAPDVQVESSLTEGMQVDANLRLRGTATNPAMLGRVNIIQGQVNFFGTKYQVNDGSISFYNPSRIVPVFDVDLTTKAQGVEVTLTISGPVDHLTLTPSSDSSLSYNDIISLLVTGRPPTSDPALLSGQNALGPGSFQQMGASALLGQAIAAPVSGRLQRFFGVSSLRIDPTIPGIDANPAARLTLQQQITPSITFTYITSVTTSNPQIVQVEWAVNSKWSVVALREENGMTGMDFYFKKKF
jgi:translocation and assembly module TamB